MVKHFVKESLKESLVKILTYCAMNAATELFNTLKYTSVNEYNNSWSIFANFSRVDRDSIKNIQQSSCPNRVFMCKLF